MKRPHTPTLSNRPIKKGLFDQPDHDIHEISSPLPLLPEEIWLLIGSFSGVSVLKTLREVSHFLSIALAITLKERWKGRYFTEESRFHWLYDVVFTYYESECQNPAVDILLQLDPREFLARIVKEVTRGGGDARGLDSRTLVRLLELFSQFPANPMITTVLINMLSADTAGRKLERYGKERSQIAAVHALGERLHEGAQVIDALTARLADPLPSISAAAAEALSGKYTLDLAPIAPSESRSRSRDASPGPNGSEVLMENLHSADWPTRKALAAALGEQLADADVLAALMHLIDDEKNEVREVAVDSLGMVGSDSNVTTTLIEVLKKDACSRVREAAACALGTMNPIATADLISALVEAAVEDPGDGVREAAVHTLAYTTPAPDIVDALLEVISDQCTYYVSSVYTRGQKIAVKAGKAVVFEKSKRGDSYMIRIANADLYNIDFDNPSYATLEKILGNGFEVEIKNPDHIIALTNILVSQEFTDVDDDDSERQYTLFSDARPIKMLAIQYLISFRPICTLGIIDILNQELPRNWFADDSAIAEIGDVELTHCHSNSLDFYFLLELITILRDQIEMVFSPYAGSPLNTVGLFSCATNKGEASNLSPSDFGVRL